MEEINLAGTKTEKNLMEAFAGESQARNKYTYFALLKLEKKDMSKLQLYLKKQHKMKKNMQKCGSNYYKVEISNLQ